MMIMLPLLENGPSVQAKDTSCCCSRYRWYPSVPAATAAGTFGLGPTYWRTIDTGWWFQCVSIGTGLNHHPVPNECGAIGTG